jgi:hypothetical protein
MEGPGLTTQLRRDRDKKKQAVHESSHRKWLVEPTRSPGLRLMRACLSNVSGAKLATSGHSVPISKHQQSPRGWTITTRIEQMGSESDPGVR